MQDDPAYLTVGTEVSAKYKGAFCEAKIKKVVRVVKCRVLFKGGLGSHLLSDDVVRGTLRVGATVEAKHPDKAVFSEATISKIQDCSQYTVVFDDGDITTLRRSALCLKSGRHFNESETLDQLPLTHPEHFSNPVVGGSGRRGVRGRRAANEDKEESSDEEETPSQKRRRGDGSEIDCGKVVCVDISDKKKGRDTWFPALVVSPSAQETVKIRVKDDCLVRSFKDGRYYTVPKKEITEFVKEQHGKGDSSSTVLRTAVEKAVSYLDKDELPPHWDRDALFGTSAGDDDEGSDSDAGDDQQSEKKDNFVAQLYKFMEERGSPINKAPTVCNKDLDLHKLYTVVMENGGYSKVSNATQWKFVTTRLGYGIMPSTSTINLVKTAYKKYLLPFEEINKKLGYNIHTQATTSKPRNSRSVYRTTAPAAAVPPPQKKETVVKEEEEKVDKEEKKEEEQDTASIDSDKKTGDDFRKSRPRSRQDSSRSRKGPEDDDKDKGSLEKRRGRPPGKDKLDKETEKVKREKDEEMKEPPSPATSKKRVGVGRKPKQREEEPVKETVEKKDPIDTSRIGCIGKDVKVQTGDKLMVIYPKGDDTVTYDAKVLDMDEKAGTYLVHYQGWNTRYDEWIPRTRIAENLSLREGTYTSKPQGKGPQSSTSEDSLKEKEEKKGRKRGRSTTPAPTSSTGTRSKSSQSSASSAPSPTPTPLKRKRLSTDKEREDSKEKDTKRKRKKEESESEVEQEKEKAPRPSSATPTRATSKKEKEREINKKQDKEAKEAEDKGKAPSKKDEKSPQVLDLNQIRSEMKGLDKIVKHTRAEKDKKNISPSSIGGPGSEGKMDIYEFEEDINEAQAPKLKMFSPRSASPEKKDEKEKDPKDKEEKVEKKRGPASEKEKTPKAASGPAVAAVITPPQQAVATTGTRPVTLAAGVGTSPPVGIPRTPQVTPAIRLRPSSPAAVVIPSTAAVIQTPQLPQVQRIPLVTPTQSQQTVTIYAAGPVPTPPHPSLASPVIIPTVGNNRPSLGPGAAPVMTMIRPVQSPVAGIVATTAPMGVGLAPVTVRDPKLLPTFARKQEVFPHLIQQQHKEVPPTRPARVPTPPYAAPSVPSPPPLSDIVTATAPPAPTPDKKKSKRSPSKQRIDQGDKERKRNDRDKSKEKEKPEKPEKPKNLRGKKRDASPKISKGQGSVPAPVSPAVSTLSSGMSSPSKVMKIELSKCAVPASPIIKKPAANLQPTPSLQDVESKISDLMQTVEKEVKPLPQAHLKTLAPTTPMQQTPSYPHRKEEKGQRGTPSSASGRSKMVSKEDKQLTASAMDKTVTSSPIGGSSKLPEAGKYHSVSPHALANYPQNSMGLLTSAAASIAEQAERERKGLLSAKDIKQGNKDDNRPLTPSFLQSKETMEPEDDEEMMVERSWKRKKDDVYTLSAKAVLVNMNKEESCSSLLCEEEIPGSPAPGDREEKYRPPKEFDEDLDLDVPLDEDDEDDMAEFEDKPYEISRPTLLPKKGGKRNKPRLVERSQSMVVLHDTSPPSTPDSTSFSTETGSPHIDSGRMTPPMDRLEGGSSKSKDDDSSDGDSGDNSKSYYSGSPGTGSRKSSKIEQPASPLSKASAARSRSSHLISSPLSKKRRMIRRKSPTDDYARQFGYRGIRSSSGRKIQSSIDVHEAMKGPPPPPVNLAKRPQSDKYNHLYADLEGVTDPEDRIALILKSMQDIREEWLNVKNRIQGRERKERRKKRRAREKAAADRQARLEAAKTMAAQSQGPPPVPAPQTDVKN